MIFPDVIPGFVDYKKLLNMKTITNYLNLNYSIMSFQEKIKLKWGARIMDAGNVYTIYFDEADEPALHTMLRTWYMCFDNVMSIEFFRVDTGEIIRTFNGN